MQILQRHTLFGIAICLLSFAASALAQLPTEVQRQLTAAKIDPSGVGVLAVRLSDGKVLFEHQPTKPLQPASTMKVLAAIAGLELLGPTHRGRVELLHTGTIDNGVLSGDLILRGRASPDFTWEELRKLIRTVRAKGIVEVKGNVLIDRHHFRPSRLDIGLPPFDEAPEFQYNVIPDALLMNTNLSQIEIDSRASQITARMTPWPDGVKLNLSFRLVDRPCAQWEEGWKIPVTSKDAKGETTVMLHGEYPRNCATTVNVSVLDRADYVARLFTTLWKEEGGELRGRVMEADARLTEGAVLAAHSSRTLAEFSRDVNKRSDNPMTRLLFLSIGAQAQETNVANQSQPTLVVAEAEVRRWLKSKGIDDTGIVLDNGSGLSRSEKISAAQLTAVLKAAYRSDWAPEFLSTLPIIGVDGAMRTRLAESAAKNKGRVKTGTLRNVVSVAGFIPDASGEMCAVVAIINDDKAGARVMRPIVDSVLSAVTQTLR